MKIEELEDGHFDLEVIKAELRAELRIVRRLQFELQSKIARFAAPPNTLLMRRVAALEAEIRRMKANDEDRQARRRAWRESLEETAH